MRHPRRALLLPLALLSSACISGLDQVPEAVDSADRRDNVETMRLEVALRQMDDDDFFFDDFEEQYTAGITYDRRPTDGHFGWEGGFYRSRADEDVGGDDFDINTTEYFLGARWTMFDGQWAAFTPYVGAGVSYLDLDFDRQGFDSFDDHTWGYYGHGGVYINVGSGMVFGADLRVLTGSDLEFDTDADYVQLGVFLGAYW